MEQYERGEATFNEENVILNMATIERINMYVGLHVMMLKFESFKPIQVLSSIASLTQTSTQFHASNQSHARGIKLRDNKKVKSNEGWTLITHKRSKKNRESLSSQFHTSNQSHAGSIKLRDNKKVKSNEAWILITHKRSKEKRGSLPKQSLVKRPTKRTMSQKGERKLNRGINEKGFVQKP